MKTTNIWKRKLNLTNWSLVQIIWFWFWQIIHSPPRGVSREWGVALYGAYAADINLDSSALTDAVVDCSTTWDGSEFQSPTVRTAKDWRNACVEEPTAQNLNRCFAIVHSFLPSSHETDQACSTARGDADGGYCRCTVNIHSYIDNNL